MICIDYAENEDVKRFFTEMSSNFEAFQKPLPSEVKKIGREWGLKGGQAVDNIVGCIGGNLEDLDRVVTGLTRGDAYFNVRIILSPDYPITRSSHRPIT